MSIDTITECAWELQAKLGIRFDIDGVRDSVEEIMSAQGLEMPESEIEESCQAVLAQQAQMFPIHCGQPIFSVNGESDSDPDDAERETGPAAYGFLAERDDKNAQWSVYFPNGTAVWITDQELADTSCYRIMYLGEGAFTKLPTIDRERSPGQAEITIKGTLDQAPNIPYTISLQAVAASDFEPDNSASVEHGEITIDYCVMAIDTEIASGTISHEGDRSNLLQHLIDHRNDLLKDIQHAVANPATEGEQEQPDMRTSAPIPRG